MKLFAVFHIYLRGAQLSDNQKNDGYPTPAPAGGGMYSSGCKSTPYPPRAPQKAPPSASKIPNHAPPNAPPPPGKARQPPAKNRNA